MEFFGEFKDLSETRGYEQLGLPSELALTNPVCGDEVRVKVELRQGVIASFAYEARGCWPVFGCLQWLGDRFTERNVSEALGFELEEFLNQVNGVPAGKRHAFSLAHRAFRRAVTLAMIENELEPVGTVGPSGQERV